IVDIFRKGNFRFVHLLDIRGTMRALREKEALYRRDDIHWTNTGAFFGIRELAYEIVRVLRPSGRVPEMRLENYVIAIGAPEIGVLEDFRSATELPGRWLHISPPGGKWNVSWSHDGKKFGDEIPLVEPIFSRAHRPMLHARILALHNSFFANAFPLLSE